MVEPALLEQVLQLPAEDRRALMVEISESLVAEEPLTPEFRALADERLADLKANPSDWKPWDQVRRELFGRHLS